MLKKHIIMYATIVIRDLIVIFTLTFKILNMVTKDLNRLKVVLVEKKKTGVWLAEQLGNEILLFNNNSL